MRIISGKHKGRRISAPKQLPVRPTTDRVKEALFNILQHTYDLENVSVLDLFAGMGNISYEFASRGSTDIHCVDKNARCLAFIQKTAQELEMDLHTVKSDALKFLNTTQTRYDIIFADPPYAMDAEMIAEIPRLVIRRDLLLPGGVLIIEHAEKLGLESLAGFAEKRKYGGSYLSFFRPLNE